MKKKFPTPTGGPSSPLILPLPLPIPKEQFTADKDVKKK